MKRTHLRWGVLAAIALSVSLPAAADVSLPAVFSDHMVLQQGLPVPVWGWGEPGEKVTVRFAGQTQTTQANAQGRWSVKLTKLEASAKPAVLEVAGTNTVRLQDVLVGEVWLCSGQSNMEWSVSGTMNAKDELAAAKYPQIRLFNVPGHTTAPMPQDKGKGQWQVCAPETVGRFSAVGYFFGRRLHKELKVPVGLIGSNWGGTRIEPWTPAVGFRQVPELKDLSAKVDQFDYTTPEGRKVWQAYIGQVETWLAAARKALESGGTVPAAPREPGFRGGGDPTAIYNSMVHPLTPFAMQGAIWYQGESNGGEGESYYHKMRALIGGWRTVFENPTLGFYWVQLANFRQPNPNPAGGDGWAKIREAQRKTLTVPHTGMAVTTDIGNARDIHPRNKQDVGSRLAQWALHQTYKKADLVPSGPLYTSHKVEAGKIRVSFEYAGSGLMVGQKEGLAPTKCLPDGELKHFAVAGADKKWHWAKAKIDGQTVLVWSDEVPKPVAVRYAYATNPAGANLYNKEGLPAAPFRTDDW